MSESDNRTDEDCARPDPALLLEDGEQQLFVRGIDVRPDAHGRAHRTLKIASKPSPR
jgi:hypothetical protein